MKRPLLALVFACLAAPLAATPTRISAVDNGTFLVPDDWDATYYYSLSPNFKNHFYFDRYWDGTSLGWAFLDLRYATLVLWWNKPFEAGALYSGAASFGAPAGVTSTAFGTKVSQDWEPRENRVQAPDNKAALGLGIPLSDSLNLGFCFRYATLDQRQEGSKADGSGNPAPYGPTLAGLVDGAGGLYTPMSTTAYTSRQGSTGLVLSPQFSWFAERFTLSVKGDLVWTGVDNEHREDVYSSQGTGTVTQSLKERGTLSWAVKPHMRWMLNQQDSLVLRGEYARLGFNLDHRVKGSFSGGSFSGVQAAGFDHIDASEELSVSPWECFAGYVHAFDHGRSLVVIGAGVQGETDTVTDRSWQVRPSGASSYDDLVPLRRYDATEDKLQVPVLMGAEIGVKPWLKARGMVTRNFYHRDGTRSLDEGYSTATGALSSSVKAEAQDDVGASWKAVLGFGIDLGSFSWDLSANSGFLGASTGAGFVNPIYDSSFTYAF